MSVALSQLYVEFADSTDDMVRRFDTPLPSCEPFASTCTTIHEHGQSLLVVRLQNSWSNFCRRLIDISASNNTQGVRRAAKRVASDMGTGYPVWHNPEFVVRMAKRLTLPNEGRIDLHFGANLSSGRVTHVRNYIVHPHGGTKSKYSQVAADEGMPGLDVGKLLNVRFPGGTTLFERWVKDLQRTASETTK